MVRPHPEPPTPRSRNLPRVALGPRAVPTALRLVACLVLMLVVIGVPRAPSPTLGSMPLSHLLRGAAPVAAPANRLGVESRVHALLRGEARAANALDADLVALARAGTEPMAIVAAALRVGERDVLEPAPETVRAELEPPALDGDFGLAVAIATRANLERLDPPSREALATLVAAVERAGLEAEAAGCLDPRRVELASRIAQALARGDAPAQADLEAASTFRDGAMVAASVRLLHAIDHARGVFARAWRDPERLGLFTLPSGDEWPRDLVLALRSRAGLILVTGPAASVIPTRGVAAVIDMGGDDVYTDAIGLPGIALVDVPATFVLDLDGDDDYVGSRGRLGGGIGGIGLIDDSDGRDTYEARAPGIGVGILGVALLVDRAGDDRYDGERVAFGAAAFGTAVVVDVEGDDRYQVRGFGLGAASDAGFAAVVDASGYDLVIVAPSRADVDSACVAVGGISISGFGPPGTALWFDRRGDDILRIAPGCGAYADGCGLALAIDVGGDDVVSSGDWCLGSARAAGFALYRDLAGADRVVARRQSLGFASDAIALAIDDGGEDERITLEPGRGAREHGGAGVFADLPDETPR